ncbi:MAG: hypothetical protein GEU90_16305 [Gemmatimonas sp.]|nr:hypothetical protein [Gemmatimonas sp.]
MLRAICRHRALQPALVGLALAMILDVATAQAQRRPREGRGAFEAGFMLLDLDDLNSALGSAGYSSLDDTFLTLGGPLSGTRSKMFLGIEGHGLLTEEESTADGSRQVSLDGGYGLFRLGYLAYSDSGFDVIPAIGVGGGSVRLKIAELVAPSFDDILEDPGRSSTLRMDMFLVDASVGIDYRFVTSRERRRAGGFLAGLRGGYVFAPWSTSWDLEGIASVGGGPDANIQGFYLRASVGGWGRGSRRR